MLAIALPLWLCTASLFVASGCTAEPVRPPIDLTGPANPTNPANPTAAPTGAMATFPARERRCVFEVTAGRHPPKRMDANMAWKDDTTLVLHVGELREIWFDIREDAIGVSRDIDDSENVRVIYDPPLRFLTADLSANRAIEGESKMTVYDLKTGNLRDQGTCRYRVEWVGQKQADSKLGKLDVTHIRMTRSINLNLATVEITIDQLRHPTFGLVRGYTVRNTKALGLIGSTATEDMQLVEFEPAELPTHRNGESNQP